MSNDVQRLITQLEILRQACQKIASGCGRDMLGVNSLSREDMQSIASDALNKINLETE